MSARDVFFVQSRQAAATTGNRCPQSPYSAPKFVRQHIAIVMQPINHFPAHYDFIDRSKKSAEVRMSEIIRSGRRVGSASWLFPPPDAWRLTDALRKRFGSFEDYLGGSVPPSPVQAIHRRPSGIVAST